MELHKSITVPYEYTELIRSICNTYHPSCESEITKENIDWNKVRFCNAMGSIKNRIDKANAGNFEVDYEWALNLGIAFSELYPNDGRNYTKDIENLRKFLFEQTGHK